LVDALLSLPSLRCVDFGFCPVTASMLAGLLRCPTLKSLLAFAPVPGITPLLNSAASTAMLCNALRANMQLQELQLNNVDLWRNIGAATSLLTALETHPSLQTLRLGMNRPRHVHAVGAALGALIAHSPKLQLLDIMFCRLGDAGMGPIMDALPHARCLHMLECRENHMSRHFARTRMLPAVRACAPLRQLEATSGGRADVSDISDIVGAAQRLLEQRS
jgi:hypothetical protein